MEGLGRISILDLGPSRASHLRDLARLLSLACGILLAEISREQEERRRRPLRGVRILDLLGLGLGLGLGLDRGARNDRSRLKERNRLGRVEIVLRRKDADQILVGLVDGGKKRSVGERHAELLGSVES